MGKFGELEYQFHLYGAFDAVKAEKWDWAKKEFQMLIKDNPTAEAYTGLILCELRITELHPNAVYVPGGVNAFPCPKYRKEMKSKWYCDNLDEIAAQYVKEPYFTRKDLENCFMVDEELHPVYSWFYYLWREKHKFTDWWHNSILVTKADLLATEEQKQAGKIAQARAALVRLYREYVGGFYNWIRKKWNEFKEAGQKSIDEAAASK